MKLVSKVTESLHERRRLRRRTSLQIALADRFSQLNEATWRAATSGGSFFHSADYQRAFERFRPENIEPRYALVCAGDEPLAAVCIQIVDVSLSQVGKNTKRKGLQRLRGNVHQRMLVCGNLLAYGIHGVSFAAGADRQAVWPAVTEALYRIRRAEKLAGNTDIVLIKDVDHAAMEESRVVEKLSYGSVPTEPNMVLALDPAWKSYDHYLQGLTSKYRTDVKNRIFKKFDASGCRIEALDDVQQHADTLHALYLQVHGNASLRPFQLTPGYWSGLADIGRGNVVIHVARQQDRIIGFIISLKDGDTALAYHIGFDRQASEQGVPVYLRLLHASVAQAIEFGCRRVSFGRTALEPKARMGCTAERTYLWVRHRHPLLNQIVQPLLKLIEPVEAPQFTPFKSAGAG
jgi:hypothetical protein